MPKRILLIDIPALIILSLLAKSIAYFPIDLYITKSLQQINAGWFDSLMKLLSFIGDPPRFAPLALLVGLVFIYFKKKREALFIYLSLIGVVAIGQILKTIVSRARPDPNLIHQYLHQLARDSFPSGHVLAFIGLFGALIIIIKKTIKEGKVKKILQIVLFTLILLIGLSRIYLGEHWFSDVAGSYLLGIAWLYILEAKSRRFI